MRRFFHLGLPFLLAAFAGCPFFGVTDPDAGSPTGEVTHRERDVSGKLSVALGGVASGNDEIVFDESIQLLELQNDDSDLFSLNLRDGFTSYTNGKGAKVIPHTEGIGYVTPTINGKARNPVEVTIPPQKLIQILIGEARGELDRESSLEVDDDGKERVKSSSVSVTGDAVGAVIRNRIDLINETANPELFLSDPDDYGLNPPVSYYEAVIEANNGFTYQFSPVDPDDPSNPYYLAAANRDDLGKTTLIAYDQAVLTAAALFNGDTEDPTGGAFGFYSPSASEYEVLQGALEIGALDLPAEGGTSDVNFPALAPIQILILDEIARQARDENVPSFVFIRSRDELDPAVTDEP